VKVTGCPTTAGFAEDETVALLLAWFTAWAIAEDVLPVKFVSPE
jgi:hypothetical protein